MFCNRDEFEGEIRVFPQEYSILCSGLRKTFLEKTRKPQMAAQKTMPTFSVFYLLLTMQIYYVAIYNNKCFPAKRIAIQLMET